MISLNARRAGWALVAASMMAAGLSTGVRIYYVILYALLAMPLLGVVAVVWTLMTLRFDMKGVRPRVIRGETLMTVFTVRHLSLLPVSSVRIELSVPSAYSPTRHVTVTTPPFVRRTFRNVIDCPHRGVYDAGVTRIRVTDVFGLICFSRKPKAVRVRLEVAPRARTVEPMALTSVDVGPQVRSRASEDNASPSDIRAWQAGDELKKVHWKLSLRRRTLMVRTYEESARPDTLILPDLSAYTDVKDRQLTLEDCVCEACLSAAKAQLEAGYPVRMPLVSAQPGEVEGQHPADIERFRDALTRVRFDCPYGYEQALLLMQPRLQRTGGIVLATARLDSRVAAMAVRMQRAGIAVKLILVSEDEGEEAMAMLARLKMTGVLAERVDPWEDAVSAAEDEYDSL